SVSAGYGLKLQNECKQVCGKPLLRRLGFRELRRVANPDFALRHANRFGMQGFEKGHAIVLSPLAVVKLHLSGNGQHRNRRAAQRLHRLRATDLSDGATALVRGVKLFGMIGGGCELLQIAVDGRELKINSLESDKWLPSNSGLRFRSGC